MRLTEATQRLQAQQEAAAAAANNRPSSVQQHQQQQQPPPPPPVSEPSEGAMSLSAPVTLNDKQARTAAALLSSLGTTAGRGRERLGRLERVLNTIAADAAEPHKVGGAGFCEGCWSCGCVCAVRCLSIV